MAAEKGLEKSGGLEAADIQQLVQLPPAAAKEIVAKKLGIAPYLDTQDQQKAPFITYIYENVMFAAEKGFPWEHIALVAKFAHQFLKGILVEKHHLPDAIRDFKKKAIILEPLSNHHKQQYVDYIHETVLCHYNLYKYVFSRLRDTIKPKVTKEVIAPPIPPPLSEGQKVNVWEYQQQVKEVEKREAEVMKRLREERSRKDPEASAHKTLEDLENVSIPYSKMSLEELVKDVLKGYAEEKEKELKAKAVELTEDIAFKLEKTAMPRPAALGSPPRFKPNSPSVGKKSSTLKPEKRMSAKSERAKSGRASVASSKSKIK